MRTMLISLALFCSLIQIAIAIAGPPQPPNSAARIPDCGTGEIYICYVPEICLYGPETGKSWTDYEVKEVEKTTEVNNNCPALIRYHLYTTYWAYISIESLQDLTVIDSVEFLHTDNQRVEHTKFSCKKDSNGKIIGKYNYDAKSPKEEEVYSGDPSSKLKCMFEIKKQWMDTNSVLQGIFKAVSYSSIAFNIGDSKTKPAPAPPSFAVRCDQSNLIYYPPEDDKTKLFKKLECEPGNCFCENSNYKIEFRRDGSNEKYKPATEIKCEQNMFKIGGEEFYHEHEIDIRCVAEAKYFCKYEVKGAGANKTSVRGPDMNPNAESSLECPIGKNHLVIVGEDGWEKPMMNPKFECLHSGGDITNWKVTAENEIEELTKDGPNVYCTSDVKCNYFFTILESAVTNGFVDANDFLPKCYETGTLYVEDEGTEKILENTKCDGPTGQFKYIVKNSEGITTEKDIKNTTKFLCKYPKNAVEEQNAKNEDRILYGSLGAGVGALVLVVVFIIILRIVYAYCKRRERKRAMKGGNAAFLLYANDVEKKNPNDKGKGKSAATPDKQPEKPGKKAKKASNATLSNALVGSEEWNAMQMSTQFEGLGAWASEDKQECPAKEEELNKLDDKDTAKYLPKPKTHQLDNKGMTPETKAAQYGFASLALGYEVDKYGIDAVHEADIRLAKEEKKKQKKK